MRLRLHRDDNPEDDAPAPLPFPRDRAPGRLDDRRRSTQSPGQGPRTEDAASAADEALSDLQRGIDELEEILESLPFPHASDEDEGPFAA